MSAVPSCTDPSRVAVEDELMDVIAVVLGIAAFAILLLLIEGIDRV
jgi:hypothetical protein